ncbi:MAG: Na(+)/H(+) antiporter subunit B [Planctomycetes bacterium]|jgi:multicomponent Na+:H+ antiporter subunit B|nr:Na(+)/H(+) antiporter subunit B [Planctomycetota bacterium]
MTTLILRTAMKVIAPLSLLFAAYMTLKGHNEPGGGFIGGLIAATTLVLYRMSDGPGALHRLIPIHPRHLLVLGLMMAMGTGLVPMLFGEPFLRSYTAYVNLGFASVHLASVMIFDVGVLLVVVGVSVGMIVRLSEEVEAVEQSRLQEPPA